MPAFYLVSFHQRASPLASGSSRLITVYYSLSVVSAECSQRQDESRLIGVTASPMCERLASVRHVHQDMYFVLRVVTVTVGVL